LALDQLEIDYNGQELTISGVTAATQEEINAKAGVTAATNDNTTALNNNTVAQQEEEQVTT